MSPASATEGQVPAFIRQRLSAVNIRTAAIVDDTYDGISSEALGDDLDAFEAALSIGRTLFEEVQKLCAGIKQPEDFDLDMAKELWIARDHWNEIVRPPAESLFSVYAQKQDRLEKLTENLTQIGLKVHTVRPTEKVPEDVQLVFLDLCLEPKKERDLLMQKKEQLDRGEQITELFSISGRAETFAKGLAARGPTRPFLILISDHDELGAVQQEFRSRASYLASTFTCLSKNQAVDPHILYFHLCCCGVGNPALRPIHKFFLAIMDSLDATTKAFRETLNTLDIQDYSFIQRLSLSSDGEPLGEYMLDLFAAALSFELRDANAVREARAVMDEQYFAAHLPSAAQPSVSVRRLYTRAITHPGVGDLAPHPLQHLQNPVPEFVVPRLCLGDILAKDDGGVVFMVINPGCDLQFSPTNPKRLPDPDLPVYLVPGKLEPLNEPMSNDSSTRTELFEVGDRAFRIAWDPKYAFTVFLRNLSSWCHQNQYRRIARLESTHALSVQQEWTSDLSRVGLPVTPPLTDSADFEIYLPDSQHRLEKIGIRESGQIILGKCRKEGQLSDCFLLTQKGMLRLRTALEDMMTRSLAFSGKIPSGEHQPAQSQSFIKRVEAGQTCLNDWSYWFGLVEQEHVLERVPNKQARMETVTFCWQSSPAGKSIKTDYGGNRVLMVVNILYPQTMKMERTVEPAIPIGERIRKRAHEIYLQRGCEPGHDRDDWLRAENEVMQLPVQAAIVMHFGPASVHNSELLTASDTTNQTGQVTSLAGEESPVGKPQVKEPECL